MSSTSNTKAISLMEKEAETNNNNNTHLYQSVDGSNNDNQNMSSSSTIPWYARTRTRQILAVVGVLAFVGIFLILTAIFIDMQNNDDNNNNNNNNGNQNDPLLKTAGVHPCEHPVFCKGDLLREVQMNKVFEDNMRFVDLPIRFGVDYVLGNFSTLLATKNGKSQPEWKQDLVDFLDQHFMMNTSDITNAGVPPDFKEKFPATSSINDADLKVFAQDVHTKWKDLYRSFNLDQFCDNCSSAIPLPFPFIVPGGRFGTTFYWDSYWIIQGLLTSGMQETARKMILNLLSLVSRLGYVPNGARNYLSDRSQPPFLTWMVNEYVEMTGDSSMILIALPTLDKEYQFWDKYRRAPLKNYGGDTYLLSRFYSVLTTPRPEGYAIDENIKANCPAWNKETIFSNLRSGAETGWDFSSRWFKDRATIEACSTNDVVPVDLNAVLLKNEQLLESWFNSQADAASYTPAAARAKAAFYGKQWRLRQQSMLDLMWNNESAAFRDISVDKNDQFTDNVPISSKWALYGANSAALSISSIANVIKNNYNKAQEAVNTINGAIVRIGGAGASNLTTTGQQWDGVDEWAPVVYFTQQAFQNLLGSSTTDSKDMVQNWIRTTYCGYKWNGTIGGTYVEKAMWEKYNNSEIGFPGTGGEYTVQTGFGWTNGLTLKWLKDFGSSLVSGGACPK